MLRFHQYILCLIFLFFISLPVYSQCFSTQSFTAIGEHTYIIPGNPSDTYEIEIQTQGADGGDFLWGSNPQSNGGGGASLSASFEVSGGDQMFVIVGQSGFDAIGSPGGGGGGGGSAVVINGTDVLIAAAAGGGGGQNTIGEGGFASTNSSAQGGAAPGTSGGGGFNANGMNGVNSTGGGAGTLTGQGSGGTQGVVAGPGGAGFGGGGGGAGTGGGGGGGYQGGDGAAVGSLNGKGGDSFLNSAYSSNLISNSNGADGDGNNQNGFVSITCLNYISLPTCATNLIIPVLLQDENRAEINIQSSALINSVNDVLFAAGVSIDLVSGFEVTLGTVFEAVIAPCEID